MERSWASVAAAAGGPGCERLADGFLAEPVSAWTSLAFVAAGAVLVVQDVRRARRPGSTRETRRSDGPVYAALVAGVGVGSFVQHGPDPSWSDLAHDLPLLGALAFLGADAAADLVGRVRRVRWWALPTVGLVPLIVLAPRAGDLAQVGVAVVAVTVTVLRAVARPDLRRPIGWALGLLTVGATLGTLSRAGGPHCDPRSVWQGHAAWHVLAAGALVVLGRTVGRVGRGS